MSNAFFPRLYWDIFDAAQSDTDVTIPKSDNLIQYAYEKFRTPLSSVFFILDFTQDKYLEIGPERNLFTGYTSDYVKAMGPTNWMGTWVQEDFKVMNEEIIPQNMGLLQRYQPKDIENIVFTTNYRVKAKDGSDITLYQKNTYIVNEHGIPLVTVGTVEDISAVKSDNRMVNKAEYIEKTLHSYKKIRLHQSYHFPDQNQGILTNREIEVLRCVCKGMNSQQIADVLHISFNTVNNHRKNMLQKTSAKNAAELIVYAVKNTLI